MVFRPGRNACITSPEMSVVPDSVFACPGTGCSPRPPKKWCCESTARIPVRVEPGRRAAVPLALGRDGRAGDGRVLLLNATYEPLTTVGLRRAVCLVLGGKAEVVHDDAAGAVLHAATVALVTPSVIRLSRYVRVPYRNRVPLTRAALMRRDNYRCAYCGRRAETIDHVIPRSRGGQHVWENCVASCTICNHQKADRMLEELGWTLAVPPVVPRGAHWRLVGAHHDGDPQWAAYLRESSAALKPSAALGARAMPEQPRTFTIAKIPADGVGREVVEAGQRVLGLHRRPVGRQACVRMGRVSVGMRVLRQNRPHDGRRRPEILTGFDAIYFGAVGWGDVPDHISLFRGLRLIHHPRIRPVAINVAAGQVPARHPEPAAQGRRTANFTVLRSAS